ncbi:50S ribosomal protein L30e [Candidatus Micrarchaeota archaeon]|nr:50S ribosomal protein L30e [Candidatus Micrarchaeota archaeon]
MDINASIRMAVDTGKTILGSEKTRKVALLGEAKLIVVARNCPLVVKQDIQHYALLSKTPVIEFKGTSIELGVVCGKPFPVSALSVIDAGNSDILTVSS